MPGIFDRTIGSLRIQNMTTLEVGWLLRRTALLRLGQRLPVTMEIGEVQSRYRATARSGKPLGHLIERLRKQDAHYDWEELKDTLFILPKKDAILRHMVSPVEIQDEYLLHVLPKTWHAQESAEPMGDLMIGLYEPVDHTANPLALAHHRFSLSGEAMSLRDLLFHLIDQSSVPFDFILSKAPEEVKTFTYHLDIRV